ncbi:chymase-like [Erinaceus europaeus]|uniref:Chymase-like n=1 Tax=Erinaceus europaeus TaxID=9365 RepID=A0A1S3AMY1_ERIEU|nr:chymase-like [Erinaceus europaeus]
MLLLPLALLCFSLCSGAKAGEIIGGKECRPHSHPYMAFLEITSSLGKLSACGGLLIRKDFVLTAAHCAGRSITVILGVHNIREQEGTWQMLKAEKQFPHPQYENVTFLNDIMLLKLEKKANLTLAVSTAPLAAEFDFISPKRTCQVAGWGRTEVNGHASDTLQEVKLRLMGPQDCMQYRAFDNNLQLCVGNSRKTKNVFKGDSGGPLMCAGVAQGVVSYVRLDGKPPAVFTRISHYRAWINKILKENQPRSLDQPRGT